MVTRGTTNRRIVIIAIKICRRRGASQGVHLLPSSTESRTRARHRCRSRRHARHYWTVTGTSRTQRIDAGRT